MNMLLIYLLCCDFLAEFDSENQGSKKIDKKGMMGSHLAVSYKHWSRHVDGDWIGSAQFTWFICLNKQNNMFQSSELM